MYIPFYRPGSGTITCREAAWRWVHTYASGGGTFAALPIPYAQTAALSALETHMIYWIAKIYGETLSPTDVTIVGSGLEIAGRALKTVAMAACSFIPKGAWAVKSVIAAGVVESVGAAVIRHYEAKYPGKLFREAEPAAAPAKAEPSPAPSPAPASGSDGEKKKE